MADDNFLSNKVIHQIRNDFASFQKTAITWTALYASSDKRSNSVFAKTKQRDIPVDLHEHLFTPRAIN